jgi:hypothetical protein
MDFPSTKRFLLEQNYGSSVHIDNYADDIVQDHVKKVHKYVGACVCMRGSAHAWKANVYMYVYMYAVCAVYH